MVARATEDELISYDAAAEILGIKRTSVKQLVVRGHLRSVPAPDDRRRRRLVRSDVLAYQQAHAGKWSYSERDVGNSQLQHPTKTVGSLSAETALAGAASGVALLLLVDAFRKEPDTVLRAAALAAIVGLALLLILEWQRQGRVEPAEKRWFERLAKRATVEGETEPFLAAVKKLFGTEQS
jgi:excisionase family DNA binding protein